jgi:hypothetical protein
LEGSEVQIVDEPKDQTSSKTAFLRKIPRQLELEDILKFVYSAQKSNYHVIDGDFFLDFLSSNILRIGKCN